MKLVVERLGHLGDGIAPGPVYVPMALPGEEVEGEVVDGRMFAPRILTPSSDRVRPGCPHYKACGGCSLMHASDSFVAEWKAEVVRSALKAHGLEAPFRPVITSQSASRRRATLAGRRTKSGALVGFHGKASETIVEIPNCRLLHPALVEMLPYLVELTVLGASRKSVLSMTVTLTDAGVDLAVTGGKALDQTLFSDLAAFARDAGLVRLSWDGEVAIAAAPAQIRIGDAAIILPPGAFLQATADGEAALVAAVGEAVSGTRQIADLFSGVGTFTLPLARDAEVHAVEGESALLEALDAGWRRTEGCIASRPKRAISFSDRFYRTSCGASMPSSSTRLAQAPRRNPGRSGTAPLGLLPQCRATPSPSRAMLISCPKQALESNGFRLSISSAGHTMLNWLPA